MPLLAGCATPGAVTVALSLPYQPDNVFATGRKLPGDVRRVALLPLACDARRTNLVAGRKVLEPVLFTELVKTKDFEVVQISREEMWRLTGREEWTGREVLPAGMLDTLKKASGCDAVLFCQLTLFRPYPPLAVGWRMKLVDVRSRKTLWAEDEQFDAGDPAVMAAARLYQRGHELVLGDDAGGWLVANSPRRFGQYALDSLLGTLPAR